MNQLTLRREEQNTLGYPGGLSGIRRILMKERQA